MAQRRMFHADVVECDRFLDLSSGAQLIYFHLGMVADDDGFVNCPRQICRKLRRPPRELRELIDSGFLLDFDGIVVLKHFRVANSLKNDRKKALSYPEIAKQLRIQQNRIYTTEMQEGEPTLYDLRTNSGLEKSGFHLDSQPKRREENQTEENRTEQNLTEENQIDEEEEESGAYAPEERSDQLRLMGGTLGKGVILLSDDQINHLLTYMGLDAFDYYVEKLARKIKEGKRDYINHYATILDWYTKDKEVRT